MGGAVAAAYGPVPAVPLDLLAADAARRPSRYAYRLASVVRATMIGVMGSAVFPGRVGEPTRVLVLARRLEGRTRHLLAVIAGTVFSQTLINLLALAILAAVTFSSVSIFHGHEAGLAGALAVPALICLLVLGGPSLLRLARRSRVARVRRTAIAIPRRPGSRLRDHPAGGRGRHGAGAGRARAAGRGPELARHTPRAAGGAGGGHGGGRLASARLSRPARAATGAANGWFAGPRWARSRSGP